MKNTSPAPRTPEAGRREKMEESLSKVLAFVFFIVLGWFLRRFNILKPEAFHAISALVMCVTLPCVTVTGLNGIEIGAQLADIALIGLVANVILLLIGFAVTMRTADPDLRDFRRLNISGFSIGPFVIPYVQAFLPPAGLLTALVFDLGNAVMAAGGNYAVISGFREKTSPVRMVKVIAKKLATSGPVIAFFVMMVLCLMHVTLPAGVVNAAKIGAAANTFLCMIMIGESMNLSLNMREFIDIMKILVLRFVCQVTLALVFYYLLPFDIEARRALVIVALAPVPAMNLIYTSQLKGDLGRAANLNSLSVAVAIATMSTAITLMQ